MEATVEALLTGRAVRFTERGERSAIAKAPVEGPRRVGWLGVEGDEQADLTVHGGRDKAIHHYPRDHYPGWQASIGPHPKFDAPGAFGENISTTGWTETEVCIGDRLRLGSALVEVSEGRQPCWKQAHHLGRPGIVAAMVKSGRSGWYYRVIEEGAVAAGDNIALVERVHSEWPVARVFGLIIGGKHKGQAAALRDLARVEQLAEGWRARAAKLAR
ncbi:MAG: MOSC domain-containing protein [Sphingomonas sp.]|uniref:MOSC domain-containing protein n=1 Tax=Sphingomonas sp. TaxID=28214 RepID=UPI0017AB979B|nr:MOSC domain-containing protein [Sphingomonas sp.]MBA3666738.1 MOSC domain-containing protein [Sphingomonas sp.]